MKNMPKYRFTLNGDISISRSNGLYFVTHTENCKDPLRIFPIYHESIYLQKKLEEALHRLSKRKDNLRVLDMCTGCGIHAISSAISGSNEVYAVDINSKALEFAKFNSVLNGLNGKIQFLEGNLFDPIPEGTKFDLICTNPPSLPIPTGIKYYLHSYGGPDGLRIVRKLLDNVDKFINEHGIFQMISFSLSNGDKPLIIDETLRRFGNSKASLTFLELSKPMKLRIYVKRLKKKARNKANNREIIHWEKTMINKGISSLYYLFIQIDFGKKAKVNSSKDYQLSKQIFNDLIESGFPYFPIQFRSYN